MSLLFELDKKNAKNKSIIKTFLLICPIFLGTPLKNLNSGKEMKSLQCFKIYFLILKEDEIQIRLSFVRDDMGTEI